MQSTVGFAPAPEDFDDLLFDAPVIVMRSPQPETPPTDKDTAQGEP
jgi:hypothetical protein